MVVYQNLIATVGILVGLFASGEWKDIKGEMGSFESGRVSYIMNIVGTAVSWQVFSIGYVGLIFEVSSLFSNVITTLSIPIVPVLAVMFFDEKMNGVKVISMLLAIWGFLSYIYQHYLDDLKEKESARLLNWFSLPHCTLLSEKEERSLTAFPFLLSGPLNFPETKLSQEIDPHYCLTHPVRSPVPWLTTTLYPPTISLVAINRRWSTGISRLRAFFPSPRESPSTVEPHPSIEMLIKISYDSSFSSVPSSAGGASTSSRSVINRRLMFDFIHVSFVFTVVHSHSYHPIKHRTRAQKALSLLSI
ncbi:unnamed protein product [Lactuca saligna]|uniref:Probable purine permease n=1 Tax=Lactuca saligna TaxID=75948 RepID=A0AA35VI63_LACSI|nr:unnamed protein product [Lactuca saligna]